MTALLSGGGRRTGAAETLYRQLLPARRRVHGADSPVVARTLNGLALSLLAQGRPELAEPNVREALAIDRARTTIPIELGQSLNNLGRVLMARDSFPAAERAFREAESLRRGHLGDGHPEVDNAVSNVASALAARGEFPEAFAAHGRRARPEATQHGRTSSGRRGGHGCTSRHSLYSDKRRRRVRAPWRLRSSGTDGFG